MAKTGKQTDLERAANLMAHPFAMVAAGSAISFGLASQAIGLWMGTVAGTMEALNRAAQTDFDQARRTGAYRPDASSTAKARAAVESLAAEANVVARHATAAVATAARKGARAASAPAIPTAGLQAVRPTTSDDLKAISGVGPKLEKALNDAGMWTYAQIAALTEAQVDRLDRQFGLSGRIGRDGWIEQAAKLAKGG